MCWSGEAEAFGVPFVSQAVRPEAVRAVSVRPVSCCGLGLYLCWRAGIRVGGREASFNTRKLQRSERGHFLRGYGGEMGGRMTVRKQAKRQRVKLWNARDRCGEDMSSWTEEGGEWEGAFPSRAPLSSDSPDW